MAAADGHVRIERLEAERRERARLEKQLRREEEARRQELEAARIRDLGRRVTDWTKAKAILEFVDAVGAAVRERDVPTVADHPAPVGHPPFASRLPSDSR